MPRKRPATPQQCAVPGCPPKYEYLSWGYCGRHYQQWRLRQNNRDLRPMFVGSETDPSPIQIRDGLAYIECYHKGQRHEGVINVEDIDKVKSYRWHLNESGYVATTQLGPKTKSILLHRLIMGVAFDADSRKRIVDHVNHVRHDNRRINLRLTDMAGNAHNVTPSGRPIYPGVWYQPYWSDKKPWVATMIHKDIRNSRMFETYEEAVAQRKEWEWQRDNGRLVKHQRRQFTGVRLANADTFPIWCVTIRFQGRNIVHYTHDENEAWTTRAEWEKQKRLGFIIKPSSTTLLERIYGDIEKAKTYARSQQLDLGWG